MSPSPCTLALLGPIPPGPALRLDGLADRFDELLLCSDDVQAHLALRQAVVAPLGALPLGAILAVLALSRNDRVVVADLPTAASPELDRLAHPAEEADVLLLARDLLVPGCYHRRSQRALERALRGGKQGEAALRGLRVVVV